MAAHHYVSKFHLREFCDPDSLHTPDQMTDGVAPYARAPSRLLDEAIRLPLYGKALPAFDFRLKTGGP